MPWHVVKSGSGYRVKNKETGKTYSKKPQSKAKATAQMRAMYANTNESRKRSLSLAEKLDNISSEVEFDDPDFAYDREREEKGRPEPDDGPDPDFAYDERREEGTMDEGLDDRTEVQAEAFRIAEEAYKTGDEGYVKKLCREAAAEFGVTIYQMFRMAEAMYNKHFATI